MRLIPAVLLVLLLCNAQFGITGETAERWRVVSQRIILPEAAHALERKLRRQGLRAQLFMRKEAIELHVFDDATLYHGYAQAKAARQRWQQQGIDDAEIYPASGRHGYFRIGLGRYYLDEYALARQQQLEHSGRAFTYARMKKTIPVYRLTFPPGSRQGMAALWQQLHRTGLGQAVQMPETEFHKLYASDKPQTPARNQAPTSSAKRSNR